MYIEDFGARDEKGVLGGVLLDLVGFTGGSRLVTDNPVGIQEETISWKDITRIEENYIPDDQLKDGHLLFQTISQYSHKTVLSLGRKGPELPVLLPVIDSTHQNDQTYSQHNGSPLDPMMKRALLHILIDPDAQRYQRCPRQEQQSLILIGLPEEPQESRWGRVRDHVLPKGPSTGIQDPDAAAIGRVALGRIDTETLADPQDAAEFGQAAWILRVNQTPQLRRCKRKYYCC